ncbi:SPOR domain-containing protein [Pyxidicoccus parkwayensis]|uniref:SPOR domain-containing protein n=1 Tax=Pyxidicoccus parkwayensis TaxID=2813578 RepID=A0ABX7P7V8_9BACT|nr:SPOR domain-containing protein [Pyxidicoccus parkwaysis]QSQ26533.1 SPOR domain-containing protein [Pyxidicoccus parkwaysis]
MRDAHRMKEKFDVSLDNRQIVSLLIAGIVVMGAVFVLGVVVGKKLAGNAQTASAPDLLSALDANAQALQDVQKRDAQLTFQDELTKKAASEPVAIAAAPKPTPKPAAAKPAEVAPKPTAERPKLAPTPDPDTGELPPEEPEPEKVVAAEPPSAPAEKPAAEAQKPEPAKTEVAKAEPSKPEPAKAEPSKPAPTKTEVAKAEVKAVPVSGKVEAAAVPTRTTNKEGGGLKEAIARAAQPPDQAVKGGAFTLQLSAFQDRQEADRFAARLRDRGYAPYILAAEVPGKGTWYRVRMGSFATRDAASRYLADFKRETSLDAFVAGTN